MNRHVVGNYIALLLSAAAATSLFLSSGCASSPSSTAFPGLQAAFNAALGTPLELAVYSEMYFHENNRWPANYDDLKSFASRNSSIEGTNSAPPLADCHSADFTFLTNGDLQIRYSWSIQTNSLSTNQLVLSPIESVSTNDLRIRQITIQ